MHVLTRVVLRRCVAGALAVLLLWLMSLPVGAEELRIRDRTGDMWNATSLDGDFVPAPRRSDMDYVRARFVHTDKRVIFKGKFVQLRKPTHQIFSMYTHIRDEDGKRRELSMAADRRSVDSGLLTVRGREVRCEVRHRLNYRRNTIRLSFSRRCMDNPRSLQFHAGSSFSPGRRSDAFIIDDAHSSKALSADWTAKVHASNAADCVTRPEYRRINDGMRRSRVKRILDFQHRWGEYRSSDPRITQVHYEACGQAANVAVHYRKRGGVWHVVAKDRLG